MAVEITQPTALTPKKILPPWVGPLAILVLLVIALLVLHGELRAYRYHDITRAIFALPRSNVLMAFLFTAIAYALLPAYDAIALSYVGRRCRCIASRSARSFPTG